MNYLLTSQLSARIFAALTIAALLASVLPMSAVHAQTAGAGGGSVLTTASETVWLEISKAVYPGEFTGTLDEEDFSFHITGGGVDETVAHGEKVELPVGTYAVTESYTGTDPIGFNAADWTAEWDGDVCELDDAVSATEPGTLVVLEGDVGKFVEGNPGRCTVTNIYDPVVVIPDTAEFLLEKKISDNITPDGFSPDDFSFKITGDGISETIVTLDPPVGGLAQGTVTLPLGDYTVEEVGPTGFVPEDWTVQWSGSGCVNGNVAIQPTTMTVTSDQSGNVCRADNQYRGDDTNTEVLGCTDDAAVNYNPDATQDDGSCEYDEPNQCVPAEPGWADEIESADQGETKSEGAITNPDRTNPAEALGASDWNDGDSDGFYSLGFGGSVVFGFGPHGFVTDAEGDDISIHEATNGDTYPEERALVEVSQDGSTWYEVGTASNLTDLSTRVSYFDIATSGLAWIKYVKVTDTTDPDLHVPAADGFDLDAVDTTKTVCTEPDDGGGNGGNDGDTYIIEGYVWHDENENKEWDGFQDEEAESAEEELTGWTVNIVNEAATESHSTTTNPDGYYYFEVPAGTWTISEVIKDDWAITTPVDNQHVVTVPEVLTQTFGERLFAFLIPTAHAAVVETYGLFNFGNDFTGGGGGSDDDITSSGSGSGSGGGGSVRPVCESLDVIESAGLYTLSWETRRGDELTITQNGTDIYYTDTDADVDAGSALVTTDAADFVLTVSRGSRSDTCELSPSDGSGAPQGQVLGEQVSVVPLGAADAGAGGTAVPVGYWITLLVGSAVRPRDEV